MIVEFGFKSNDPSDTAAEADDENDAGDKQDGDGWPDCDDADEEEEYVSLYPSNISSTLPFAEDRECTCPTPFSTAAPLLRTSSPSIAVICLVFLSILVVSSVSILSGRPKRREFIQKNTAALFPRQ
jgi:hypothetical protein